MTSGSLWKNLFFFSLPLMFSQVIEVLFNMSDVAVVGKFADYTALGAVGSTTILVTLFTGFMIGLGNGINVRVAHDLGSGNQRAIKASLHSAFVISFITGVLLCLICNLFSRSFLVLLHTKQELIGQAVAYLKIYSLGFPGLAIYNCGNGILSARGETKRPLMYLSIAGVLNVLLNLFFVIVCHMAASGVALASMIAQYTSATFIVVHLLRRNDACQLIPSQIRIDRPATRSILILGIPAGIQNSIFAFANLFVQVGVNSFDAVIVSGNAAAANADTLIYNVMAAFYTGCASFIGQNWGAGNKARILKSYLISLFYSFMIGLTLGGLLFFFGRPFLSLFATKSSCHLCRHAANPHHGIYLLYFRIYGLYDRSFPWNRQRKRPYGYCDFRILCFPSDLDLYGVCLFPYDSGVVSFVYLLLDDHRMCGNPVFRS